LVTLVRSPRGTPGIEHDQGAVEIVVYNRAILLFATESEGG
jgi:hypothetical protein